ncbi:hypothetical protein GCM10023331_10010 [Algivirga pacifica]|uniref:Ribonuclease 3 n=2 Tax=Algivirga pacifica TaxID=1162670 RepID=A0ABP9D4Y0_9BACT
MIGVKPYNIRLYRLAMQHSSVAAESDNVKGFKESNERLEYLGDAILGAVVAEYLFKKYPYKDEGFLTEVRSRIVNRESLNRLAFKIGLNKFVEYEGKRHSAQSHKSIYGDAMEAFLGAVYLDKGFKFSRTYIINNLLQQHYDIDEVVETNTNYKSLIIEWAQKNGHSVEFAISKPGGGKSNKQFKVNLVVDGEIMATGSGYSKKKAEQDAARKTCDILDVS